MRPLQVIPALANIAARMGPTCGWDRFLPALNTVFSCRQGNTSQLQIRRILSSRQQQRYSSSSASAFVSPVNLPPIRMKNACLDTADGMLNTVWDDGSDAQFPLVWLRENCQCNDCFHPSSLQRIFLLRNLNLECTTTNIELVDGGLRLTWEDGHVSELTAKWLRERRFGQDSTAAMKPWKAIQPQLWDRDAMQGRVATDALHNLLTDDHALYRWVCHLERDGVFLITDAARKEGELNKLGDRVAFLRKTNYGETFTVKAKVSVSNVAYTSATLGFHTDLADWGYAPGMQMLHCIRQVSGEGGDNQLVDAFYIAEMMRRDHPEHFQLLTTLPVQFVDIGDDYYPYHQLYTAPVFGLNEDGQLERIAYSNHSRSSTMLNVTPTMVKDFYHALKCFEDMLNVGDHHIQLKLKEGEIICFHNYRILHARTGFAVEGDGERHLEGAYMDWDELRSRRRILQTQLNIAI